MLLANIVDNLADFCLLHNLDVHSRLDIKSGESQ